MLVFLACAVLPGDPARAQLGLEATPENVRLLQHALGLDRSLVSQYFGWLGGMLHGNFGQSYVTHVDIGSQIRERLGVSFALISGGVVVALLIAIPLGVLAALNHRKRAGAALTVVSQIGLAIPSFWAAIMLVFVFAVQLRWLPAGGYTALVDDPFQWARHLLLPWLALGLVQGAILMRYVRSAVLDVMGEDFIRTARSVGRTRLSAVVSHGLRNAAIPVVTVLGVQLSTLLVGAILIESVFTLPGLGSMLLQAVANRDLLLVQGTVMTLVGAVLAINWAVDVTYVALDPRLRSE